MNLHHGDCLDVMAEMEPESVDAIVTDPPYGLEFMGKEWDRLWVASPNGQSGRIDGRGGMDTFGKRPTYQAGPQAQEFHARWAEAAYRVAKPSAYLLAFGGTRTVHRMTVALEDAGWIIRDMLVWGYASGFPKSKASLKPAWEPIVMARKPGPLRMLNIDECRIGYVSDGDREQAMVPQPVSGFASSILETPRGRNGETFDPKTGRWPANLVLTDPIFDGGVEGVVGGGETGRDTVHRRVVAGAAIGNGATMGHFVAADDVESGYGDSGTYSRFFTIPITMGVCRYCGVPIADESSRDGGTPDTPSGTAPESASSLPSSSSSDPAPSVASRSGEAGASTARQSARLWDDEGGASRSERPTTSGTASPSSSESEPITLPTPRSKLPGTSPRNTSPSSPASPAAPTETSSATTTTTGGHLMCASCADLVMRSSTDEPGFAEQPDSPRWFLVPKADRTDREPVLGGLPLEPMHLSGGRVVNTPKGDGTGIRENRPRANVHPTVKPTDLMRHLVRLVTPAGGVVLDPFLGSGTTALAAEMEGFDWIGIEREAEYVAIAEARLNGTQRGLGLDVGAPIPKMLDEAVK